MANHVSAEKRHRQNVKRKANNISRLSRVKTFVKKFESAFTSKDTASAQSAFRLAQSELMKAAQKGVIHKNAATRKVSRLSARLKSLSA